MRSKEMICDICNNTVKPLDAHLGRLEGKLITTHIDCWNRKIEENKKKSRFVITVKGEDLDCVKKALTVINNCIYEEGNIISEYNVKLLNALLGENWTERYEFGKRFISDN